jgi:hypothetical protein
VKYWVCVLTFLSALASALADGGVIVGRTTAEGWQVTLFAAPAPLRAGPGDVTVLVQDAATGSPVLDAEVTVGWTATQPAASTDWLPPCCTMDTAPGQQAARRGHSQNKLLYGAIVPMRAAGPGQLAVSIRAGDRALDWTVPIEVARPQAPLLTYWPLVALPVGAVGIFSLHQRLSRRKTQPL